MKETSIDMNEAPNEMDQLPPPQLVHADGRRIAWSQASMQADEQPRCKIISRNQVHPVNLETL